MRPETSDTAVTNNRSQVLDDPMDKVKAENNNLRSFINLEQRRVDTLKMILEIKEMGTHGARTESIIEAEKAFAKTAKEMIAKSEQPSLPKLEINFDDKLKYFAEHSLVVDRVRRVAYDFEQNPQMAKAYYGAPLVTLGAAVVGLGVLKNPAATAYMTTVGCENFAAGAAAGMTAGAGMQWWFTSAQLKNQLPSSRLPEFKAIRMHE